MDDPIARTTALFNALAPTYDAVGVDFFQPIARSLLAAMPPSLGERWLDVGCGRGAVLLPVAEAVGPSGWAEGIDISPAMVAAASQLLSAAGLTNAHVAVGNAMAPDVTAGPFDAVASSLVLFFLPDPVAALRAWAPLLREGGRLGVTTFGRLDDRWADVEDVLTPYLPPAMLDARASGTRGPFASEVGMEELVDTAGYVDVHSAVDTIAVHFADAEAWFAFSWSVGQRALWLAIPDDQRDTVKEAAMARFANHADGDGSAIFRQDIRHTLALRPA